MNQKTLTILAVVIIVIAGVGGAAVLMKDDNSPADDNSSADTDKVDITKDAVGREITVPENLDNGIITIGSAGPLRFLSIFDVYDKIVEVDKGDVTDAKHGRAYSYAYDYSGLPSHPDTKLDAANVERIGQNPPSLIIMQEKVYVEYKDLADVLAGRTCMLVIHNETWTEFFDKDFKLQSLYKDNVNMIGKVLKMEDRAAEHIKAVQDIFDDIRSLVNDKNPGKTYVAGVTIFGTNEWTTTFPYYMPLALTGGNNAYTGSETGERAVMQAEEAKQYIMNSDRVIIDPSSSDKMKTVNSQSVMTAIYEVNNDSDPNNDIDLYVTCPIVWDYLNYDCVLASAYYLIQIQYGTLTQEQTEQKIVDVFEAYYGSHGTSVLDDMKEFFVDKSSNNGVQLPMLNPVKIVFTDGQYRTAPL